jgi:hypothetical protein
MNLPEHRPASQSVKPRPIPWGTVAAAAERLGVHQSHLSRVLAGKRLSRRLLSRFENLPRDPSGRFLPE